MKKSENLLYLNITYNMVIMSIDDVSMVGSKGEILPKKLIREYSGISPGDRILIEARKGMIFIRKILSVEEAMDLPIIAKGKPEEIEKEIEEDLEQIGNNE